MNKIQKYITNLGVTLNEDTFESLEQFPEEVETFFFKDPIENQNFLDIYVDCLQQLNCAVDIGSIDMISKHDSRYFDKHTSTMIGGRDYYEIWQILLVDWEPDFVILDEEKNLIVNKKFQSMGDVYEQLVELDKIWANNSEAQDATWYGNDDELKKIMDKELIKHEDELE